MILILCCGFPSQANVRTHPKGKELWCFPEVKVVQAKLLSSQYEVLYEENENTVVIDEVSGQDIEGLVVVEVPAPELSVHDTHAFTGSSSLNQCPCMYPNSA